MFKNTIKQILISSAVFAAGLPNALGSESCMPIGGVGMPNFVAQADGSFTIVAPLTGSVSNAAGKVTGQRKTTTGLEMDMEHYFMTDKGGFMHTKDLGILTRVVGRDNHFMIEITYEIQPESTSGELAGYAGQFSSFGHVDLASLQGLIRYNGQICK